MTSHAELPAGTVLGSPWPSESVPSNEPPHTGYKCSFVQPPPHGMTTRCAVCLYIAREPHIILCCRELSEVCRGCITLLKRETQLHCQFCNKTLEPFPDKELSSFLCDRLVWCSQKDSGCPWQGKLLEFDEHLKSCCFQKETCPHCGQLFGTSAYKDHEQNCPSKILFCSSCRTHKGTAANLNRNHSEQCPFKFVLCPFGCRAKLLRKNLDRHKIRCPSLKAAVQKSAISTHSIKYLRVTNLPSGTDESMLRCVFARYGEVRGVRYNESSGLAVVVYQKESSTKAALVYARKCGITLMSHKLHIDPVY